MSDYENHLKRRASSQSLSRRRALGGAAAAGAGAAAPGLAGCRDENDDGGAPTDPAWQGRQA
ncbi:MAG: hypothetical protein M9925_16915 [Chloroflexi bacterium]|nr:hypothetical protein [Thermomicrobiales bacterium]MCO5203366.1 hypothetical protein [Chloroflexota bacterium]MCZ7576409.1 hypothetical protein [Dehalococcoidia bacterium]